MPPSEWCVNNFILHEGFIVGYLFALFGVAHFILQSMSWINEISLKTLPQSLLGKAITYAINQKEYLCSFLKDGRIQLSNNLAEQSIRMFVIGRKNWIFSNTANGANSSALIYSIVQTAIANNLKPEHYLTYVYEQIQLQKELELENLLPWSEKIPEECKKKTSD